MIYHTRHASTATSTCNVSPTNGVIASMNNWPMFSWYYTTYGQLLGMSDGYVYIAGHRAKTGFCNTQAELRAESNLSGVMIKRFTFDVTTGETGLVEHVAGTDVDNSGTNAAATNADPTTFDFSGRITGLKENYNTGVGMQLFFLQGIDSNKKLRRIDLTEGSVSNHILTNTFMSDISTPQVFANAWDFALFNVNKNGTAGIVYWVNRTHAVYATNLGTGATTAINKAGLEGSLISTIDLEPERGALIYTDGNDDSTVFRHPIVITEAMSDLATNATVSEVSPGDYELNWTNPSPLGSNKGYRVAYKAGVVAPLDCVDDFEGVEDVLTATTHTFSGLTPGAPYSFRICGYNNSGVSNAGVEVSL